MRIRSEKVTFANAAGQSLAGRLDRPAGPARAFAVFAHCFSCSKDVLAAARIGEALAERGIGVLRFDFTGLGASEGAFADSNFSSNVADLVAAAGWLRDNFEAPSLLIGHSLGGAAALVAAHSLPEIKAVATVGAPANADHAEKQFADLVRTIEEAGEANVLLGGRPFQIRKQFLDDIRGQRVLEAAATLNRALLVLHAPLDQIVGVENATALFVAAKHPKSFVGLEGADHMLTGKGHARFAAAMIAAWAERFVEEKPWGVDEPAARDTVRVEETGEGLLQNWVAFDGFTVLADEPEPIGGDDSGPAPFEWVAAGLGTCTSITMRLYAKRKGFAVDRIRVDVAHRRAPAAQFGRVSTAADGSIDVFDKQIFVKAPRLDAESLARLLEIADRCPVNRLLSPGAVINAVHLPWPDER